MKIEQVFVGNLKICTKVEEHVSVSGETYIGGKLAFRESLGYAEVEDKLYKENVVLIKFENGGFVELEKFNSMLDYIKIRRDYKEKSFLLGGLILDDRAHRVNDIFVDSESLKPYYNQEQKKKVSIRRLKREMKTIR